MASHQGEGLKSTRRTTADLSDDDLWKIVAEAADGTGINLPTVQGDIAAGILATEGEDGELVTVIEAGPAKVRLGATFDRKDYPFMTNTSGQAIPWTAGNHAVGFVRETGVANDIVECFVAKHGDSTVS